MTNPSAQSQPSPAQPDPSRPDPAPLANTGVVVIGRNEGPRLLRALQSVLGRVREVVYADSGSTDGSAAQAAALGARVVTVQGPPFTAAMGRQTGLDALLAAHPDLDYVQFVDGDCVVDPAWLDAAHAFMRTHHKAGAISGRRREEFPDLTLYNALIDIDWIAAPGPAPYPGGDSFCRVAALRAVKGWSVDLIAGEDPDLGFKMTAAGWEVHRLAQEMTLHDVRMNSFHAYWKRALRAGYCYAEVGWKHRFGAGKAWVRRTQSALAYGLGAPALFLLGLAIAIVPHPVTRLGGVALVLLALALLAKLALALSQHCTRLGVRPPLRGEYVRHNIACKLAQALGALRYYRDATFGKPATLIEYHAPPPQARPQAAPPPLPSPRPQSPEPRP